MRELNKRDEEMRKLNKDIKEQMVPSRPPPRLQLQPSGETKATVEENLRRLYSYLDKNPQCTGPKLGNCLPLATDAISPQGIDPNILEKWIQMIAAGRYPLPSESGIYKLYYFRNFSSRPPLNNEIGQQM